MTSGPATVVLVAESYPYDCAAEQTFLEREVPILVEEFDRVVLAPEKADGALLAFPPQAELDLSLATRLRVATRFGLAARAPLSGLLTREIVERPGALLHMTTLKLLVGYAGRAQLARAWARELLHRRPSRPLVLYSYWWGPLSTGFGLAGRHEKGVAMISRAHGSDLYEERHDPPYLPCRLASLQALDVLFPASDRGAAYVRERYRARVPIEVALLGVADPGGIAHPSTDGVLRVASCSFAVPVKRLDLLLDGIICVARRAPRRRFEWTHFGKGPGLRALSDRAADLPANMMALFPGYSTQKDLISYYLSRPVDVFVNVSASEGTPVSIMEAISVGIPIVATAVGGNPEIAGRDNGLLLPANPTPNDIADALMRIGTDAALATRLRRGSRMLWASRYNATTNFRAFAKRLRALSG